MCGIAGVFHKNSFVSASDAKKMLAAISHRGPDDSGIVCFRTADKNSLWMQPVGNRGLLPEKNGFNLILGHVRLSIIDLSDAGHQPMSTPDKRLWITYNGEIFNFSELKKQLENRNYKFNSSTDTEALLYAYKEYGKSCLEHLRGFFSFCIYDAEKNELFFARDRLGLKPLKYYWDGQCFAFASELKALLQLPWVARDADPFAIDRYLAYRYIPAPLTGIKNIYKLPSGCSMTLSLENPSRGPVVNRYWRPMFEPKTTLSFHNAGEKLIELMGESTRIRLMSDVPLGVFLSGGLDSSCIVSLLRKYFDGEIRTFSVGFADDRFDERPFARTVASRFKTVHTELLAEPKPDEDLRKIIWHFDEPFGDPSAIPSFYLARAASDHVKVILNGDGGDEIFAGYKRYRIHGRNKFLDYMPQPARKTFAFMSGLIPCGADKKHGWGKIGRMLESISGDMVETYPLRFSGLSHKIRKALSGNLWDAEGNGWPEDVLDILKETAAKDRIEKLMALDQITYLPEDILVKSDLAGMAHSIENRAPFLDHIFVGWANLLPLSYKLNKKILKDAMRNELPENILNRKKTGFNPPLAAWMRTILKPGLEEYLLSENSPLNPLGTRLQKQMFDIHQSGKSNLSEPLWILLSLAVWLEINNVKIA